MNVLVTGAGGFIGSALIRALPDRHRVIGLGHGRNYPLVKESLGAHVRLIDGDLRDEAVLDEAMEGVQVVVHLAGVAGERLCRDHPAVAVQSNVTGTHLLVDRARRSRVRRFLFASSYWVYSFFDERPMPLREGDELRTDSLYGALKAASEREVADAVPHVILRLSTIYGYGSGVGMQWSGLIGKYVRAAFEGGDLTVYGDGTQAIDLLHIDDLVHVLVTLIEADAPGNSVPSILNVGGGRPVTIHEIASVVVRLARERFGRIVAARPVDAPPGKVWPPRWLSIEALARVVPGVPRVSFEEGVLDMMTRYEKASAPR